MGAGPRFGRNLLSGLTWNMYVNTAGLNLLEKKLLEKEENTQILHEMIRDPFNSTILHICESIRLILFHYCK